VKDLISFISLWFLKTEIENCSLNKPPPRFKDKERHENKWITDIPEIWEMNEESGVLLA